MVADPLGTRDLIRVKFKMYWPFQDKTRVASSENKATFLR